MKHFARQLFAFTLALLPSSPLLAQLVVEEPDYAIFNTFDVPPNLTSSLGAMLFSDDGSMVYILDDSEDDESAVWVAGVVRDDDGNVTGFGTFTQVFAYPFMDTGLEFGPGSDTLFFYVTSSGIGGIARRQANGTIEETEVGPYGNEYGGLAFIPPGYPNSGDILVSSYNDGQVFIHEASADGDGSFTVNGTGTLYADFSASIGESALADIIVVTEGPLAGNALLATYTEEGLVVVYLPIGADGLPADGSTPTPQVFASGELGAWGLAFDPVTGNIWVVDFNADLTDALYQIAGPPLPVGGGTGPATAIPTMTHVGVFLLALVTLLLGTRAMQRRT